MPACSTDNQITVIAGLDRVPFPPPHGTRHKSQTSQATTNETKDTFCRPYPFCRCFFINRHCCHNYYCMRLLATASRRPFSTRFSLLSSFGKSLRCSLILSATFSFQQHSCAAYSAAMSTHTTERDSGTITVSPKNEASQSGLVVICHGLGDSAEGFADVAEVSRRKTRNDGFSPYYR
jgi:hypothetical protein